MGPVALFDKSFLQSLSVDESVWLDHFFLVVIAPFFYIETLADLGKPAGGGRTPETEVQMIADKFPDNATPCVHHADAALADLSGRTIPMNGIVPTPGGRPVRAAGRNVVVWDEAPECKAFSRWQAQDFLTVERDFARRWRAALSDTPMDAIWGAMKQAGIGGESSRTLAEAKAVADAAVRNPDKTLPLVSLLLLFLGASERTTGGILNTWQQSGSPPLNEYAPYAAFVLTVEVFFQVALAAGLIARQRPSNRVDIAYLFYLPFGHVFLSNDKLHAKCAPLFLRGDQEFIEGGSLKSDLRALNAHLLEERGDDDDRDVWSFAHTRPPDVAPLVSRLWGKYMGRHQDEHPAAAPTKYHRKTIREIDEMYSAPGIPLDQINFDVSNPDAIVLARRVRRRKGSWRQLPKDV